MAEQKETGGLKIFEVNINTWSKMAQTTIHSYGKESVMEYPAAKKVTRPMLTYGAYTCYAGVAKSPKSGLYLFHFYEDDAYKRLVDAIGGEPLSGVYGGIPYHIERTSENQFNNTKLKFLDPKDSAIGGFNILINGDEIYYSAGQFNP